MPHSWNIDADPNQPEHSIETASADLQLLNDQFDMGSDALSAADYVDYPGEDQVLACPIVCCVTHLQLHHSDYWCQSSQAEWHSQVEDDLDEGQLTGTV